MKNILGVLGLIATLAGCATALTSEELEYTNQLTSSLRPPATATGAFLITNQRDPDATRVRSLPTGLAGAFSCDVGIGQLGDELYAEDRVERLENALAEAFPDRHGEQLIVRRYDIFLNNAAYVEAVSMSAGLAAVGNYGGVSTPDVDSPEIWRRPKCERERMHGGWFDPSDLINNLQPITIDIEVSVFGRDYVINAARSPELGLNRLGTIRLERSPVFGAMLQQTMDVANARLVAAIRASEAESAAAVPVLN